MDVKEDLINSKEFKQKYNLSNEIDKILEYATNDRDLKREIRKYINSLLVEIKGNITLQELREAVGSYLDGWIACERFYGLS